MADVVVTVPMAFEYAGKRGLSAWLAEGDRPGEPWSGTYYAYTVGGARPGIIAGERVYVVCEGQLRGYAPLVELEPAGPNRWSLIRGGGAVAVTLERAVRGFRGWRYRWWERSAEVPVGAAPLFGGG